MDMLDRALIAIMLICLFVLSFIHSKEIVELRQYHQVTAPTGDE